LFIENREQKEIKELQFKSSKMVKITTCKKGKKVEEF
jgi:hypothetical protein